MIAQDEDCLALDVVDNAWLFVCVDGGPLEIVIPDPAHDGQRLLAVRQQSVLLHGDGGAVAAVGVQHAMPLVAGHVDRPVNNETGWVHRVVALAQQIAVTVDLDQGRCGDLLEEHAERVEQEMLLRPRHAHRDMGEEEIVPAMHAHESKQYRRVLDQEDGCEKELKDVSQQTSTAEDP